MHGWVGAAAAQRGRPFHARVCDAASAVCARRRLTAHVDAFQVCVVCGMPGVRRMRHVRCALYAACQVRVVCVECGSCAEGAAVPTAHVSGSDDPPHWQRSARSTAHAHSHRHSEYSHRHAAQPDARPHWSTAHADGQTRRPHTHTDTHTDRHARTHARKHGRALWSAGQAPTIPAECSTSCRDFLARCFEPDAAKRPVAKALLSHAWLDVCQS